MSKLNCLKLIIRHYDSVISKIDVYTEELLETIDPNDLMDDTRVGKLEKNDDTVLSGFEKYLTPVEPKYTPGVTRTADYIDSIRQEMIDRVSKCQQDTLDFYHENRKEFEFDPKQMDADKVEDLKRRLFGQTFCFVLNIDSFKFYYKNTRFTNNCLFKMYLIVSDHFVDQNAIDYMRIIFQASQTDNFQSDRLRKLTIDCRILVINSLVDYLGDCLMYSLGHQHLIDIKLDHLLAKKHVTLRLTKLHQKFPIELLASSALDFTDLESLEITLMYTFWQIFEFKLIGPFPNLTKLSLVEIHIEREIVLENLTNIRHLVLCDVSFTNNELDLSNLMPNLEVVQLKNIIHSDGKISGFHKLSKLEKIEFKFLIGEDLSLFANSNVSYLIFDRFNEPTKIQFALSNFPNLKHLEIIEVYGLEFDFDFKCESKLETLVLKENNFKSWKNLDLHKNLKRLEILDIVYIEINPDAFEGLTQIEEFTLNGVYKYSKEKFLDIIKKTLKNFPNLQKLNLSRNLIENLGPDVFINNPKLTHLDLSRNKLVLNKSAFQNLSNLKCLVLNSNQMKKLDDGVFMGLDNLEGIDLGGNELDETSFHQLDGLKSLKILRCDLKENLS